MRIKTFCLLTFFSAIASISLFANQAEPLAPPVATGPAVGSSVPDFQATDQNGHPVDLKSALGPKGALLVFFRSADW